MDARVHKAHAWQPPFNKAAYIHRKEIAWKDAVFKGEEEMNKVTRVRLEEVEQQSV